MQGQGNGIRAKQRICLREFNASALVTSLSQGFRVWTCSLAWLEVTWKKDQCKTLNGKAVKFNSFHLFLSFLSDFLSSLIERAIDRSKGFPEIRRSAAGGWIFERRNVESRSTSPRFPRRVKSV